LVRLLPRNVKKKIGVKVTTIKYVNKYFENCKEQIYVI
jgi:hypothetical protein